MQCKFYRGINYFRRGPEIFGPGVQIFHPPPLFLPSLTYHMQQDNCYFCALQNPTSYGLVQWQFILLGLKNYARYMWLRTYA